MFARQSSWQLLDVHEVDKGAPPIATLQGNQSMRLCTHHTKELLDGLGGLRTHAQPILCPGQIQLDVFELGRLELFARGQILGRVGCGQWGLRDRIVGAQDFHRLGTSSCLCLRQDNVVDRFAFRAETGKANAKYHGGWENRLVLAEREMEGGRGRTSRGLTVVR